MTSGRLLPSLRALQTLEAVVRRGTLSAAAHELGISVGAVSFQLREIDQAVGRRLVRREGRGLWIDPAAAAIAREMCAPFAELASAAARLRRPPERQTIRVAMLSSFAAIWFLPRLPLFQAAHPDIEVQVITGAQLVDFNAERIDCAVRCGQGNWPEVVSTLLLPQRFSPVAHPVYLAQAGRPDSPRDLQSHRLIASVDRVAEWDEWFEAAGLTAPQSALMHLVEGRDLALAAVRAKAGTALLDVSLVADSLQAQELVQLFPIELLSGWGHYFVHPAGAASPQVEQLRLWMLQQVHGGQPSAAGPPLAPGLEPAAALPTQPAAHSPQAPVQLPAPSARG